MFFEIYHKQNEGDSAHNAISHAHKNAGSVFLPSQVTSIMSLARPSKPFLVTQMQFEDDFIDFKSLYKHLRIIDAGREEDFTWNSIMELKCFEKTANYNILQKKSLTNYMPIVFLENNFYKYLELYF